ncbi:hypothetical protein HPB50_026472 [Hyalomma asiaticum]|uniref:Uncharacterized protein n=1 Tax=Hyalomma asiaticum TaxID=266040 RepID=A0ACB7SZ89_HYAAI|nr:hypothetical protein HPB50_026472 [Hyalomma asiaticum]
MERHVQAFGMLAGDVPDLAICPRPATGTAPSESKPLSLVPVVTLRHGSAAVPCVLPQLELQNQCRLPFEASSTVAELATLDPAAQALIEMRIYAAAFLTDSLAALPRGSFAGSGRALAAAQSASASRRTKTLCSLAPPSRKSTKSCATNNLEDFVSRREHTSLGARAFTALLDFFECCDYTTRL